MTKTTTKPTPTAAGNAGTVSAVRIMTSTLQPKGMSARPTPEKTTRQKPVR